MAGMMAALYAQAGLVVLPAFVAAAFLGRQTLAHSQQVLDTTKAYRSRETAVRELSRQIATERHDERKLIAADLHDEVVQPLFKVTLMAHVLKRELEQGRLIEMDEDLPELLAAAEVAGSALRDLIGDLRTSTLARGGLVPALSRLTEQLSLSCDAEFHVSLSDTHVPGELELPIYQIAKEALTNTGKHSRASNVWIELFGTSSEVVIEVRDDGVGWDATIDHDGHYGLHIMRERAELAGGTVYIDALPGRGSLVRATIPIKA
jgi:signal transduction histidine kinase